MIKLVENKNVFVVGCSRSGTTLLQSILANSPQYKAFPEANVLYHVLDNLYARQYSSLLGRKDILKSYISFVLNRFGYSRKFSNIHIENFLTNIKRLDLNVLAPKNEKAIKEVFKSFRDILNEASGQKYWIEKTPQNIFCIDLMQKYYPDDTFVHIIRDGKDNIASLIDAARKYDDFANRFGGPKGIQKAVDYWNGSIRYSYSMRGLPNHHFIRFEKLISEPLKALHSVSEALDIEFTNDMITYNTEKIINENEKWKVKQTSEVKKPESKFDKIFSKQEKEFILNKMNSVNDYFPIQ